MNNLIVIQKGLRSFALLLLLLLSGCTSTTGDNGLDIPEWVLTPTQDNAQYIYGIGDGITLEQAKQRALKDIASKFSVSVNSDTLHKQSLHNGQSDQLFSQKINTHVKAIEFTHYEQKRAEQIKDHYFLQVAISRTGFIKNNKAKLATINNNINTLLFQVENKSKIEQLYAYNKVQQEVTKAEPLLYLISVADNHFDLTHYTDKFSLYTQEEAKLLSSTNFLIKSPKKLSPIAEALSDVFQTHGLQVNRKNKADAIIQLQGKVKNTTAFSSYNSRIDFSFLVKDRKGTVYSKQTYTLNGSSITNYQLAYENAVKKFLSAIESRSDVYQLLGFEE